MNTHQGKYTQQLLSLPILENVDDLSQSLRLPKEVISKFSFNNDRYYHRIEMEKKSGGIRHIESPLKELKAIQRWVLRYILDKLSPSSFAKGFVRKKSILDNAKPHEGNQYVLNLDLKDFFTTVQASHVYTLFKNIGYNNNIAFILTSFCTKSGYLPQGAPTSPALSNLVCLRLDHRISTYCKKRALTYTRYADDLCISGNKILILQKASYLIKDIICDEGFTINSKKEKFLGPKVRREVTGLTVTPKITISKKNYCLYRKRIYDLVRTETPNKHEIIKGILSFVRSIDKDKGKKLSLFYQNQITLIADS
ncbi:TPA: retron St85 family RNA-directed DNA polymerase [Klebsiella aerogenes]|jgi:retron-type reverse transcriptase|uniref:retron St85 family RNA-directed DNA polymerase n=1 Tax=Enterobacteriaceae TaxID=543 RepID=UPI00039ED69D|nr:MULTISPECIES: retron St85 family RNA-directed DNA polymerase [Enterobacteriaceae]EKW9877302.1 retron St85 family RNA-directed DNA polymerase [Klebsiella pneumoniae]EMC2815624.1 retron St85 family RNA-directed DNA polymerase [Klebsiella pneumoniae]MCF2748666.1 retron St85 family RNA-directed DNA polymerase [Klebsiella pneumoniae]HBT5549459.1 RNA-directed DNA polymerase [Klebsiella pneumoniae]HBT5670610.1 RNA-directed DNA polymerase [Klebsiella pneumoniae]